MEQKRFKFQKTSRILKDRQGKTRCPWYPPDSPSGGFLNENCMAASQQAVLRKGGRKQIMKTNEKCFQKPLQRSNRLRIDRLDKQRRYTLCTRA